MGLFSRKKRSDSNAPSPALSTPSAVSSPLLSASTPSIAPSRPTFRLRVAVDPLPLEEDKENELFYIDVNPEEDVSAVRQAISARLGKMSMSLFKVSIPWQAQFQARAYVHRYQSPINLITHFPSYSLDDSDQLAPSLGPAWQAVGLLPPKSSNGTYRIRDWFPAAALAQEDMISILVRPAPSVPSGVTPLTLLAHFAPVDPPRSARPSSSSTAPSPKRRDPTVVDVSPHCTMDELKAMVLEADRRLGAMLNKVVMWKVEMSESEIITIEHRGGLKGGRMPWPYPPTAPVPVAIPDGSLPVSHYFPDCQSNARMVNLTVWIHSSAIQALAPMRHPSEEDAPKFVYPMILEPTPEEIPRRISLTHSLPPGSPPLPTAIEPLARMKAKRARPSTAPAVVVSPNGTPEVASFGAGSSKLAALKSRPTLKSKHALLSPSPLGAGEVAPAFLEQSLNGLGIGSVVSVANENSPDESAQVPALEFSNLSLTVDFVDDPSRPPRSDKVDWMPPAEQLSKSSLPIKTKSLGFGSLGRRMGRTTQAVA